MTVLNSVRGRSMIDLKEDMKQAEVWLNNTEGEMSEDQLIYLAATGFEDCPDFCGSKKYCKDEACSCIRATFPTPDHYHLYLLMRSQAIEWLKQGIIANAVSKEAFSNEKCQEKYK